MKIAFCTSVYPLEVRVWHSSSFGYNGLVQSLHQGLISGGDELLPIHASPRAPTLLWRAGSKLLRECLGIRTYHQADPALWEDCARRIESSLGSAGLGAEILFSAENPRLFYGVKSDRPMYCYTDAPVSSLIDQYPHLVGLRPGTVRVIQEIEKVSTRKLSGLFVPNHWAKSEFLKLCPEMSERIHVIGMGPNLPKSMTLSTASAKNSLSKRASRERFYFLFSGVDWERKGGARAVAIVDRLNELGFPSILRVVGLDPPTRSPNVERLGIVDPLSSGSHARLKEIYEDVDFMLLPTRADTAGTVLIEAKMFAVLPVGTDVMGVKETVGSHGVVLDRGGTIAEDAEQLLPFLRSRQRLAEASLSTHADFCASEDWDSVIDRLRSVMGLAPERSLGRND